MYNWSQDWQILFDVDKVMHIVHRNYKAKYEMNGTFLDEVTEERDLGVIMQSDSMQFNLQFLEWPK